MRRFTYFTDLDVDEQHQPALDFESTATVSCDHGPHLIMWGAVRITWCLVSAFAVESVIFGVAVLPAVAFWNWHLGWSMHPPWLRIIVLSMAFVPAYLIFTLVLMVLSALAMRALGWRTPPDASLPIRELSWPLLRWVRYMISIQLVKIFTGSLVRATPVWTFYLRMNGAKLGKRVFINSLGVTDHHLLDFGDDVVIGGDAHLSGHTVEDGVVRTAGVKLGRGVTIGVGSVVGIGVEAGDSCQIGALSLVPKGETLEPGAPYVGIPARKI